MNRLIVGDSDGNVVFDVSDEAYNLSDYRKLSLATGNGNSGNSDVEVSLYRHSDAPVSDSVISN